MSRDSRVLTADELVACLQRTRLPTLLVEGTTDADVYRLLEGRLRDVDVLSCGGRNTLLAVYERRIEYPNSSVAFLADRDMWLFSQTPAKYQDIIFTHGYSIENDIYTHDEIARLFQGAEPEAFERLVHTVCRWFAFEVCEFLSGRPSQVASHALQVAQFSHDGEACDIHPVFARKRGYVEPSSAQISEIFSSYTQKLRGHTLFDCLAYILSSPHRSARFSKAALRQLCATTPHHPTLPSLLSAIRGQFSPPVQSSAPIAAMDVSARPDS